MLSYVHAFALEVCMIFSMCSRVQSSHFTNPHLLLMFAQDCWWQDHLHFSQRRQRKCGSYGLQAQDFSRNAIAIVSLFEGGVKCYPIISRYTDYCMQLDNIVYTVYHPCGKSLSLSLKSTWEQHIYDEYRIFCLQNRCHFTPTRIALK